MRTDQFEQLAGELSADEQLVLVLRCIESLLSKHHLAEAASYRDIGASIAERASADLAQVYWVRLADLYWSLDQAVIDAAYEKATALLGDVSVDAFIERYRSAFQFTDGRRAFLHLASLARFLEHRGASDKAQAIVDEMFDFYSKGHDMPESVQAFMWAPVRGRTVTFSRARRRALTCQACEHLTTFMGVPACDLSKLKVTGQGFLATDLTTYEESLPHWGCLHPKREAGEGWQD